MKLQSCLPERPSFVLLAPMLNFLIILALVMTRSAALDRVKISADEAPFVLAENEQPFLVVIANQASAPFYLDRQPFEQTEPLIDQVKQLQVAAAKEGLVRNSVVIELEPGVQSDVRGPLSKALVEEGFQVAVVRRLGDGS